MAKTTCKHPDGCPRPARRHGWCTMHDQRVKANGDPGPAGRLKPIYGAMRGMTCSVEGCDAPAKLKLMCAFHYSRVRFTGEAGPAERKRRTLPPEMRQYTPGQRHRFFKYGLTVEAFDEILERQGGRCYVCGTDTPTSYGWSVDHCHETNVVRFIACNPCNAALGLIREDPEIAKRLWYVAIECRARKGGEVRATDLAEAMVALHPDLVDEALKQT